MNLNTPGREGKKPAVNFSNDFKRRQFLQTVSIIAGIFPCLGVSESRGDSGAESPKSAPTKSNEAAMELLAEMETKGGNFLNVPRKDGQFLNLLVKATRARRVLELGTSHGYSAIWIGLAFAETGGKLTTLEILSERVELAKKHVAQAGLSHCVTLLEGDAHKLVPTLEGPFDFVFLDADKDGQLDYFNKLYPNKLSPGAVVVAHNAIQRSSAMKDFLEMIGNHRDFDSVILSLTMDDGFSLSYRHRG
ncbi:MAG: O-methyltransferase [Verrucomicrobia bacterium]|nr:O-methyltransferase [Verrucomicrobiota bacterium]